MKVNTFIVGAPKAGTTSLHYYLQQHPEVCMSAIKEPNFFTAANVSDLYYDVDPILNEDDYHLIFSDLKKKVVGEASVSYLYYPLIADKIFEYNPKAKIIILLRNPVQRAFSHYLMDKRLGLCNVSLLEIIDNPQKHPQFYHQFVELGLYFSQVKRYIDVFGKEHVKLLMYDDLKLKVTSLLSSVFQFLSLDYVQVDTTVRNKFKAPSNSIISALYRFKFLRSSVNFLVPSRLLRSLKNLLFKESSKPKIDKEVLRKLALLYNKDIDQLSKLLNKDLSQWKKVN